MRKLLCLGLLSTVSLLIFAGPARAAEPALVTILATDPHAAEAGSDPGSFTVLRAGPIGDPLTVYFHVGGSAGNGTDYQALPGEVTIPANCSCAPINVRPFDDTSVEGNEYVIVALDQPAEWPPPYLITWPAVAALTIEDNDDPPVNQPPEVAIVSPPDGAVFIGPVDITLVAKAWDRDGRVRSVEFFDGNTSLGVVTARPIIITPGPIDGEKLDWAHESIPDLHPELLVEFEAVPSSDLPSIIPGNLFRLVWEDAPPGAHRLTAVATDNRGATTRSELVQIRITEPPHQPIIEIFATDPVATEPDPSGSRLDTATFEVRRSGSTTEPLDVYYAIGGLAENGVDYEEIATATTIPAGSRRAEILIRPIDDNLVEGREDVVLTLLVPPCLPIFPPPVHCYLAGRHDRALAIIRDNDPNGNLPPIVRLVRPQDGDVFRAGTDIHLVADARDPDGKVVSVEFFEGSTSLGVVTHDLSKITPQLPPFSLIWPDVRPGRYVLTAMATDDQGATDISRPVHIKVVDTQLPPVVTIVATDGEAAEPGLQPTDTSIRIVNEATLVVHRTGPTQRPLTVRYRLSGSASNGQDYEELSGLVIIPEGRSSAPITIVPLHDNLCEGTEKVVAELVPSFCADVSTVPDCYVVGDPGYAAAAILDNDICPGNRPPKVELLQPTDGSIFFSPAAIHLAAAARDPDGTVKVIEFFANNQSLGSVDNPDRTQEFLARLLWEKAGPGGYELVAVATDNEGAQGTSESVRIRVTDPPILPIITIRASDAIATEGGIQIGPPGTLGPVFLDPAVFTVHRSGRTNVDLVVYYKLEGTAQNGVDYVLRSGELTIPAGSFSAPIVIDPIEDQLVEGTETVVAELTPIACEKIYPPPAYCYAVGKPSRAIAYIQDNDFQHNLLPKVDLVAPSNGDVFDAPTEIKLVAAARDPDGWVSRMEFFEGNTKIGEDSIVFIVAPPPGQSQEFTFLWTGVPPGRYTLTALATDNRGGQTRSDPVEITVVDPNRVPVVSIVATDPWATEGPLLFDPFPIETVGGQAQDGQLLEIEPNVNPGGPVILDTATLTVHRSGLTSFPLTVHYRVSGTAVNGLDYVMLQGKVTIPENARSANITLVPLEDQLVEGTETVVLELEPSNCLPAIAPSDAMIVDCYIVGRPNRAVAYIRDNDHEPNRPPQVGLVQPQQGDVFVGPVDIRLVAKAEDSDGFVRSVEFFADGTSLGVVFNHPIRLDPIPLPVVERSGALSADEVNILPLNPFVLVWPDAPPGDHVLWAVATDNQGASTRSTEVGITVLQRSDQPIVSVAATDPVGSEGDAAISVDEPDTATFSIKRTGPTHNELLVYYRLSGTASNGVDYRELPNMVAIPEGAASVEVVVAPIDDNLVEGTESVLLTLVPPVCIAIFPPPLDCYLVGRNEAARAIILDNDGPANRPPVTALLHPQNGDTFPARSDIRLIAEAKDFDGQVRSVEFFEGENSLGTVINPTVISPLPLPVETATANPSTLLELEKSPPIRLPFPLYVLTWSNVPPGGYILTARATDNEGAVGISRPVEIKVTHREPPPVVGIEATDPQGREIDPRLDIPEDPAVFTVRRTGSTAGPLTVYYRIGGTAQNGKDYVEIERNVTIPGGAASAQIVISVLDDKECEGPESVIIVLVPSPCDTIQPAPHNCYQVGQNWQARAVIIDDEDCPPNQHPSVRIIRPSNGDIFRAGSDIPIWAEAHDRDGRVVSVVFYANNQAIGAVRDPFTNEDHLWRILWETVPAGAYALTAVATDNDGFSSTSDPVHVRVIAPPDRPVVNIVATDPIATEGNESRWSTQIDPNQSPDQAVLTVTRSGPTTQPLRVSYALTGTAENGVDYRHLSGQVVIPIGAHSARIVVDPIDDQLQEGTETVVATLRPSLCTTTDPAQSGCYLIGHGSRAVAFIRDNDSPPNLSPHVAIVRPENGQTFAAPADINIVATAVDPDGWVTQIQFYEGDNVIGGLAILVQEPPPPGLPQTFEFPWDDVPPGRYTLTAVVTDNDGASSRSEPIQIRVIDGHQVPVVTIHTLDPIATEGGTAGQLDSAVMAVRRTGSLNGPLTVRYQLSGSAENGVDYELLPGQVTLLPGEDSARIVINPIDDNLPEGVELVIANLPQPDCLATDPTPNGCYKVGEPGRAVAYIRDNDQHSNHRPFVSILRPRDGAVFPANSDITVEVHALDPDGWVTTVELYANNMKIGEQSVYFIVAPPPGQLQVFNFTWETAPSGHYSLSAKAIDNEGSMTWSRIVDITVGDPPPVVTIMAPDAYAREDGNSAFFRVRRTGPTENSLTVHYAITGTALNGVDYQALPGLVTIPAGRRTAQITLNPIADGIPEPIETVILQVVVPAIQPPPYLVGIPDAAAAIIVDHNSPRPPCRSLPGGLFHLCLPGVDGEGFRLEVSKDLDKWEPLLVNTVVDGAVHFVDEQAMKYPVRFYRAVPAVDWAALEEE